VGVMKGERRGARAVGCVAERGFRVSKTRRVAVGGVRGLESSRTWF